MQCKRWGEKTMRTNNKCFYGNNPETALLKKERKRVLKTAMSLLTKAEKIAIKFSSGFNRKRLRLTTGQIAAKLRCEAEKVKEILETGLKKLQEYMIPLEYKDLYLQIENAVSL
jgi:DNA-directed RNA polymerase sigma subunit (sigma70/sigma32)